ETTGFFGHSKKTSPASGGRQPPVVAQNRGRRPRSPRVRISVSLGTVVKCESTPTGSKSDNTAEDATESRWRPSCTRVWLTDGRRRQGVGKWRSFSWRGGGGQSGYSWPSAWPARVVKPAGRTGCTAAAPSPVS